jgi:hypothetical protein
MFPPLNKSFMMRYYRWLLEIAGLSTYGRKHTLQKRLLRHVRAETEAELRRASLLRGRGVILLARAGLPMDIARYTHSFLACSIDGISSFQRSFNTLFEGRHHSHYDARTRIAGGWSAPRHVLLIDRGVYAKSKPSGRGHTVVALAALVDVENDCDMVRADASNLRLTRCACDRMESFGDWNDLRMNAMMLQFLIEVEDQQIITARKAEALAKRRRRLIAQMLRRGVRGVGTVSV